MQSKRENLELACKENSTRFLGWSRPAVTSAAEVLVNELSKSPGCFLGHVTVLVPGQRAGRKLLSVLTRLAELRGKALVPPRLVTPGEIPELFYEPKLPLVSELESELLWVKVLRRNEEELAPLLKRALDRDFLFWHGLAQTFSRLRTELGALGTPVSRSMDKAIQEYLVIEERFELLQKLMLEFEEELCNLGQTDLHLARPQALAHGTLRSMENLILFGTLDLSPVAKSFISKSGSAFEAWVHAPEAMQEGFDAFGSVVPEFWATQLLDVDLHAVQIVRTGREQANTCLDAVSDWSHGATVDDIVIAVPEESLAPLIAESFEAQGIPVRDAQGARCVQAGPMTALELLGRFVQSRQIQDLGSIVRHADLGRYLSAQLALRGIKVADLCSIVDRYQKHALPVRLTNSLISDCKERAVVEALHGAVHALVNLNTETNSLAAWSPVFRGILLSLYGDAVLRISVAQEKIVLETLEKIDSEICGYEMLAKGEEGGALTFSDAVSLLRNRLSAERIEPNTFEAAVELVGWLELYLDDRPCVVVTSCNEGFLPESANADPFLPNSLRQSLGLANNQIRYARDSAVLSALLHSRQKLLLVVGAIGSLDEVRPPSRLLLTNPTSIAARIQTFYGQVTEEVLLERLPKGAGTSMLLPLEPKGLAGKITQVSVTGLMGYQDCPYRFYLKHIERLENLNDQATEMDTLMFGNIGHEVMRQFACDPKIASSSNREAIERYLVDRLNDQVLIQFGELLLPAVQIQVAQLKSRYKAFSLWQAEWAAQGWQIELVEHPLQGTIAAGGGELRVSARVDRIDRNITTQERAVFDYKFSDDAEGIPARKQRLQLGLYRMLLRQSGIESISNIGILPMDGSARDFSPIFISEKPGLQEEIEAAARSLADDILRGVFWPPSPNSYRGDPFARICGVGTETDEDEDMEEIGEAV